MRFHWHIWYRVPAGYKVPDSQAFASREAALDRIKQLAWAADECPEVRKEKVAFCCGL